MSMYGINPKEMECIRVAPSNPATIHNRPFSVCISMSKEASALEDQKATEKVRVYSEWLSTQWGGREWPS